MRPYSNFVILTVRYSVGSGIIRGFHLSVRISKIFKAWKRAIISDDAPHLLRGKVLAPGQSRPRASALSRGGKCIGNA